MIAVFITAPIGSFILDFAAPLLVKKKIVLNQVVPTDMNDVKKTRASMELGNKIARRLRTISLQIGSDR
ncbi:hypothetical protein GCK32_022036 [Trichostrongylus colubriformis]|uniref:Uncharacterized protein n=1 Tax=Trichostrongylus colubriformis TaxID=6319 RepID=A0AAN8FLY1_TRICO